MTKRANPFDAVVNEMRQRCLTTCEKCGRQVVASAHSSKRCEAYQNENAMEAANMLRISGDESVELTNVGVTYTYGPAVDTSLGAAPFRVITAPWAPWWAVAISRACSEDRSRARRAIRAAKTNEDLQASVMSVSALAQDIDGRAVLSLLDAYGVPATEGYDLRGVDFSAIIRSRQ